MFFLKNILLTQNPLKEPEGIKIMAQMWICVTCEILTLVFSYCCVAAEKGVDPRKIVKRMSS